MVPVDRIKTFVPQESTAQLISRRLGINIDHTAGGGKFVHKHGDAALCFALNGRVPPGKVLDVHELAAMGSKWLLINIAQVDEY